LHFEYEWNECTEVRELQTQSPTLKTSTSQSEGNVGLFLNEISRQTAGYMTCFEAIRGKKTLRKVLTLRMTYH